MVLLGSAPGHDAATAALDHVRGQAASLGIADGATLRADVRALVGHTGLFVATIEGALEGVPLSRPVARVLVAEDGRVLYVSRDANAPPLARVGAAIDGADAVARVRASGLPGSAGAGAAELVAVPGPSSSRLVWRVDPPWDREALTNPVFHVDAASGRVAVAHDRARSALIRSFLRNPVLDPDPGDYELNAIDTADGYLTGPYFRAYNCVEPAPGEPACDPTQVAVADQNGDFLYDPPPIPGAPVFEDEFAEASAYYHTDKFHLWLTDLGYVGTACHAAGEVPGMIANYKIYDGGVALAVNNAVYLADCEFMLVFGQGKDADWSYDGDVVAHEVTHGVIDELIGEGNRLGGTRARADAVVTDAGAVNEAIADFVANVFTGDPLHGEYVSEYGDGMGRNADNDYTCPQATVGEVHFDAEPFTGALWEIYDVLGDPFVPVVLDAVTMLATDATYEEAAEIVAALADAELGGDAADTVAEIMAERGLDDCARVAAWDALQRGELWLVPKSNPVLFDPMRPPPLQLRIDVPEDADTVYMTWDMEVLTPQMWEPLPDINLLLKHDAPITFTYGEDGDTITVDADSDRHVPGLNDGEVRIEVTPGDALHLALFNLGVHTAILSGFAVEFAFEGGSGTGSGSGSGTGTGTGTEGGGTSTGSGAGADGEDGCGCTHREPGNAPKALGLLALCVLAPRRRRS